MTNLQKIRQRFVVALIALAVLNVAFIAFLLWPGTSNRSARLAEKEDLQKQLKLKRDQAAPLKGIEQKLAQTRQDIKKFYAERIISRYSQISEQVQKLAQSNGVSATQMIHYKPVETELPNLQRVEIDTTIAGDYAKLAHFINALERDKLLFLISEVSLTAPQGGNVELRIKFETFLKEAA